MNMRGLPLLILAVSRTVQTVSSEAFQTETLTNSDRKAIKKRKREEKRQQKAEAAAVNFTDPLLGLEKEISDLTHLEAELTGNSAQIFVNSTSNGSLETKTEQLDESIDCTKEMCQYELTPDYLLEYKVNVPNDTTVEECVGCSLTVKLTYEGTAWLAFALSPNGEMIGSEAVIGHPLVDEAKPRKYYLGGKYDGGIQPMEDDKQTLLNAKTTFENGQSILEFEKLMKEEGEIEISTGLNTFLWAHGEDNSISTYHGQNRSPFQINLLAERDNSSALSGVASNTPSTEMTVSDDSSSDFIVPTLVSSTVSAEIPPTNEEETSILCPPAYDPSSMYMAGDIVEVGGYIWECREYPYESYCSVPDFHPILSVDDPNAEELWLNAWSKSLGECLKLSDSPSYEPSENPTTSLTTKPSAEPTLLPSVLILTALPTQSPIRVKKDIIDDDGLPFPIPKLRFVEWKKLGFSELATAKLLGYSRYSWNNLEILELEETSFDDLSSTEQYGAMALGFDEETWDCFMSHYCSYSWEKLEETDIAQYFTTLGWTQNSWDNDGKAPDSEDKSWKKLTTEEKFAATKLCYTENAWNWVALPSW